MHDESIPRISQIYPPDWDAAIYDALSVISHARDHDIQAGDARILSTNLLCSQLRHPALAKAFLAFNADHFYASTLEARVREILILRIGWLMRAEYEFIAHVNLGKRAGLSDAEIAAIQEGPDAPGWDPLDADPLRAVDELHEAAQIADAGPTSDCRLTSMSGNCWISAIVGCYGFLVMVLNTFRVQLSDSHNPSP